MANSATDWRNLLPLIASIRLFRPARVLAPRIARSQAGMRLHVFVVFEVANNPKAVRPRRAIAPVYGEEWANRPRCDPIHRSPKPLLTKSNQAHIVENQEERCRDWGWAMTGKTVTRADLCEAVYQKVGLSRTESSALVELVLKEITDCLERGETVKLSSFGSFVVRKKGQRIGRNPKTGTEVPISPRRVMVFKPSAILKQRINNHKPDGET
jgi:integration host factor subunit alpha